jgi:putative oxidoreductase
MNSFVRLGFIPAGYDLSLFVLRVMSGISLFWGHGFAKVTRYSSLAEHFSDPLHIGHRWSLILAIFAEAVCSLLLILGLGTRWAALVIAIELGMAFALIHKFKLTGEGNGELAYLYVAAMLTLVIAGGGRFSIDGKM